MNEYGIFNDEGLLEGGFWSAHSALQSLLNDYSEEDDATVHPVCPSTPTKSRTSVKSVSMSKATRASNQEVLITSSNQMSALSALLYSIATGENTVSLAPNHREDLMEMYADAFWQGRRIDQ